MMKEREKKKLRLQIVSSQLMDKEYIISVIFLRVLIPLHLVTMMMMMRMVMKISMRMMRMKMMTMMMTYLMWLTWII